MIIRRNTGQRDRISVYAGGPPMVQVFIYRYGQFCGTECFSQEKIIIGRGQDADLCLVGSTISRTHAVLYVHEDGLGIRDLFSSNGTCLNGIPVRKGSFDAMDLLSIGPYVLRFRMHAYRLPATREGFLLPLAEALEPEEDEMVTDKVAFQWLNPTGVIARAS